MRSLLVLLLLLLFITIPVKNLNAQVNSSGVSVELPIADENVEEGDIICTQNTGFIKCFRAYDPSVLGVVSPNATIAIEDEEVEGGTAIVDSGIVVVKVSAINGSIEEGNLITTSDIEGVGQLATNDGYVIGTAMENYSSDNSEEIGTIQVALNIHPAVGITSARSNLINVLRQGFAAPLLEPLSYLRYIFAALMVLISFALGLAYFGRTSRTGIEAIGRNPMAKRIIQLNIILNIILTIVIILVGLGIAYLILIL